MANKNFLFILLVCILILSVFSGSGCVDEKVTNNSNNGLDSNASEEYENQSNNSTKQNSSDSLSLLINLQEPPDEVIGG